MKGGRHNTDDACYAGCLLRQVGMTLETHEADFCPRQHFRIGRPMRLVTRLARFGPHRRAFIREWSTQIRMAGKAAGFVCGECANLLRQKATMRIVTIRA